MEEHPFLPAVETVKYIIFFLFVIISTEMFWVVWADYFSLQKNQQITETQSPENVLRKPKKQKTSPTKFLFLQIGRFRLFLCLAT